MAISSKLVAFITLLRPKQWVKNTFVIAPLIFTGEFFAHTQLILSLWATALFCLASSSVYVLNDLADIEADRKHPKKSKTRPLASGALSKTEGYFALLIVASLTAILAWLAPFPTWPILVYLVTNIGYSFYLKRQPIIDLFTLAVGFVIRVYMGAIAIAVPLSSWMFITTFALALFLAVIKRRQELVSSGNEAFSREVLRFYSIPLLDKYAEMSSTGALIFYCLFVISQRPELALSVPFVLFGFFRYWYLVQQENQGESPTDVLLKDPQLIITVLLWAGVCGYLIVQSSL